MLKIYSEPIYKRIGNRAFPDIVGTTPKAEHKVTQVCQTVTDNSSGNVSTMRKKAQQMAQELNIPFEKAVEKLHEQGEHLVDVFA